MHVTFTDAERAFADSAEGQLFVAAAQRSHRNRTAYLGDRAPAWTPEMEARAILGGAKAKARSDLARTVHDAAAPAALELAKVEHAADRVLRKERIRTAYLGR